MLKKIGKYEIIRELGKGATSAVYEAIDPFVNRRVAIKVVFPDYMQKESEAIPATEGEIRLLRGSRLEIAGKCKKSATEAFALFEDEKHPLVLQGGHSFAGVLTPKSSGLLKIDVIDEDKLGAGAPPKLVVRMVEDKAPSIDFKLRGISTIVTPQVRIPGLRECTSSDLTAAGILAGYQSAITHQLPRTAESRQRP